MHDLRIRNLKPGNPIYRVPDRLFLQDRDFEIIRFILEMKFSTVRHIYEQFFKVTKSGKKSTNTRWCTEKLCRLKKHGYLKTQKNFYSGEFLYLATDSAYDLLNKHYPSEEFQGPIKSVDFRQYFHDYQIIDIRIRLSQVFKISKWISDRNILVDERLRSYFNVSNIPDGIFQDSEGSFYFLEFENSRKARHVYREKINTYLKHMRSPDSFYAKPKRVLFICAKPAVADFLTQETRIYQDLFEVKTLEDFFKTNLTEKENQNV